MNKILDVYFVRFYTEDGSKLSIGGIETYIVNLINLAEDLSIGVRVFQYAEADFIKSYKDAIVYGVMKEKKTKKYKIDSLYERAVATREKNCFYINIIANDTLIPKWNVPNSIVIQHGIGFDGGTAANKPQLLTFARITYYAYKRIKRLQNVDKAICVDNNYICWYRTQTPNKNVELIPILNFTEIGKENVAKDNKKVKIVFARRFVPIRGTRLFAPVVKKLLYKYENVEITFAGEGPEGSFLQDMFAGNDRVKFTSYQPEESICFHQQFHIAVVPTIYSEGTSLSLLEAMSAKCAVVCTNVGGMTNVILNEYNGLMISPNQEELFEAIVRLVDSPILREKISSHAYETVKESFSVERWKRQWKKVIIEKFEQICLK